jgi:hypothetical protein
MHEGTPQNAVAEAVRHLEDAVLKAGGAVLRYGALYGPGATDAHVGLVRRRRFPLVGDGAGSWVHLDDAAAVRDRLRSAAGVFARALRRRYASGVEQEVEFAAEPSGKCAFAEDGPANEGTVVCDVNGQGVAGARWLRPTAQLVSAIDSHSTKRLSSPKITTCQIRRPD